MRAGFVSNDPQGELVLIAPMFEMGRVAAVLHPRDAVCARGLSMLRIKLPLRALPVDEEGKPLRPQRSLHASESPAQHLPVWVVTFGGCDRDRKAVGYLIQVAWAKAEGNRAITAPQPGREPERERVLRARICDSHQLDELAVTDRDDLVARPELAVLATTARLQSVILSEPANCALKIRDTVDDVIDPHRPGSLADSTRVIRPRLLPWTSGRDRTR